jgi:hypothetical protein
LAVQDWGGELTFPLPATSSTPRTWLQDQEEVWLAGNTPLPARPPVPLNSPLFQPGSYKAGLIFYNYCTEYLPFFTKAFSSKQN